MPRSKKTVLFLVFVGMLLGACPGKGGGGQTCPVNTLQNDLANTGGGGGGGQDDQKCRRSR